MHKKGFNALGDDFLAKKMVIPSLKHLWFYLFHLPIITSFTFSSALLSADDYIASYPPEFH